MPLNWNVTKCADTNKLFHKVAPTPKSAEVQKLKPMYECIIMMMMVMRLGEITKKNVKEAYFRFKLLERVHGPFVTGTDSNDKPIDIRLLYEEMFDMIGLTCNVVTESRAAFLRATMKSLERETDAACNYDQKTWALKVLRQKGEIADANAHS